MWTVKLDSGSEIKFKDSPKWDKIVSHSDSKLGYLELISSGDKCGKDLFIEQYMCEWRSDPRSRELDNALLTYYQKTPDSVGNKEAMIYWREFKEWANHSGFTSKEINQSKQRVSQRRDF